MTTLDPRSSQFWIGPSGETVTGQQTANHLDAAAAILKADIDAEYTLDQALCQVVVDGGGDLDSLRLAKTVLNLVLRERTGARYADADTWAARRGRAADEVLNLLDEAARFARLHGPQAVAA